MTDVGGSRDAIAQIYSALDSEEAFARVPEILAQAANARSAIIHVFDAHWDVQDVYLNYFTGDMLARYIDEGLWRLDPWKAPAIRSVNRFIAMDDPVPPQRLVHSAFYNENFRYWGDDTARCLGGGFDLPDGGHLGIGVHRGLRAQDFSEADLARAGAIAAHIRRLFELRRRLGAADTRAVLSEAALNAQPNAVFVVDLHSRPQLMNRQAEALAARGDALSLTRVGLRATRDTEAHFLARAIATACARKGPQGASFRLPRRSGPPLRVVVSPLSVGSRTLALVVVNEPPHADAGIVEALRGFYGLTPAEADTAASLAIGLAPVEIAEARGMSLATTRTQIRQILQKTDTRSLAEIAAAVASAPASPRSAS